MKSIDSGKSAFDAGGSYSQTLNLIQQYQDVQGRNPPSSREWQDASTKLQPLFKRMAEITGSLNSHGEVTK